MGLDMYAYSTTEDSGDISGDVLSYGTEIFYWRQNTGLHTWMENVYRSYGGKNDFNCSAIRLDCTTLDKLEGDIKNQNPLRLLGFYFGVPWFSLKNREGDLKFIREARRCLEKGLFVYYQATW